MAKKRRRYLKRKRSFTHSLSDRCKDRHHIFFQKRFYGGTLSEFRKYPYCVVLIPKNTLHHQIHSEVPNVPVPKVANAKNALAQLRTLYRYGAISDDDSIERRLVVLIALFECIEQPTADALKRQLDIVRKFYNGPR